MSKTIGVVGLGIMGGAFARNLVAAGWRVIGCDLEPARCEEARTAGIEIADSAGAVAEAAGDIVTSLPTPKAVLETARAIARAQGKGRTVIETRTLALVDKGEVQRILGDAGHTVLDCPISGTGAQAKVKDIVVYASGETGAIARLEPAFLGFARKVYDLGAYGNGSKMKFVANHLVAIHNVAAAEAMVLGMKAGLDPRRIVEVVSSGAGTSRVFELRAPMMAEASYLPASMRSTTWTKDLTVIGEFASGLACPTPLFSLSASLHAGVLAAGHGAEDTAAVCEVYAEMAGLERKGPR
jgi:3-hydroxyisobutyrate dehydrogenase-like beta-hydroxyacid dehydrogenase